MALWVGPAVDIQVTELIVKVKNKISDGKKTGGGEKLKRKQKTVISYLKGNISLQFDCKFRKCTIP